MHLHRGVFLLPALAALLAGCTSEPGGNLGTDPKKDAADIQASSPSAVKPKGKVTKPPVGPAPRGASAKPSEDL